MDKIDSLKVISEVKVNKFLRILINILEDYKESDLVTW